jgi:tellurite resistance protein TehA-like permease
MGMTVVMGTAITSIALSLDGYPHLSDALLAVAAIAYAIAAGGLATRAITDRPALLRDARAPHALATVAGTAVLGEGALGLGWTAPAAVALGIGVVLVAVLAPRIARRVPESAAGVWFLLTVAPEGSASLAAQLAVSDHARWMCWLAIGLAGVGAILYPVVVRRFELGHIVRGRGDHWVAGGSVAITVLAAASIALAVRRLYPSPAVTALMRDLVYVLWGLAMLWIAPLVTGELRRPRLHYHASRWATVFPVGMYAACSFRAAGATGWTAMAEFARVWTWVAVAVWALAFAGMVRHPTLVVPRRRMRANNDTGAPRSPG